MEENVHNKNETFNINDLGSMNSDKIRQLDRDNKMKNKFIIIGGIIILLIAIILIILIIVLTRSSDKKKQKLEK